MRILILCTGNSCRSQMAEGFLRSFDNTLEISSAGTEPADTINQTAVKVMHEAEIDISRQYPKPVDLFLKVSWDFVITVCDSANEKCPYFSGPVRHRLHIGFEDPSLKRGSEEEILAEFRRVRDEIKARFLSLYENQIKSEIKQ